MDLEKCIPQYDALKFNSQESFDKWIKETTKYLVIFCDTGQDLIKIWVAENMEIIHATTGISATLYNGRFVINGEPKPMDKLELYNPETKDRGFIRYRIKKVTVL